MKERVAGMHLRGLVAGEDLITALSGSLNAAYFGGLAWHEAASRGQRTGAAVLTMISAAEVVEAGFSQALFWWGPQLSSFGELSAGGWALARLPLLAATLLVSILVLRRLGS